MIPRDGYDIDECICGAPCYVVITNPYPGYCNDCRQRGGLYERLMDRIMEPFPERTIAEMPSPDRWIEYGPMD